MDRRAFLVAGSAALLPADNPMPIVTLGKSGLRVSKFCLGGYHMRVGGQDEGVRIIHRALDLGVTFFDSAAHYHKGESDVTYGVAFKGRQRQKAVLMSKAQLRDRDSAMKQLETTLQRMQTDYLDLWQCHEVSTHAEVDQIFGPNGALEAFVAAKKQGKVRHIGFTGHRDPSVHQRMLEGFDGWETVQMPVNLIDRHYLSFTENVLPRVKAKGLGMIAMKSNAMGPITRNRIATIEECLRYTLSQPIDVLVSGVETVAQLEQNVGIVKTFRPMSQQEVTSILDRTKKGPYGSKIESYKKPESGAFHRLHNDGEPV